MNRSSESKHPEIRIYLLGNFQVFIGQRVLPSNQWRLRKAKSLVKILALSPGHRLHREKIIDLLWPDKDLKAAINNLHQLLYDTRRFLDPDKILAQRCLVFDGDVLTLYTDGVLWVDVDQFEKAVREVHHFQEERQYQNALSFYQDDLLLDDLYEEWAAFRREDLRQTYFSLLMHFAKFYENHERYEQAIQTYKLVVAKDQFHEDAQMGIVRLMAACDRIQEAERHYLHYCEILQQELDSEPSPEIQKRYRDILDGKIHEKRTADDFKPGAPLLHNLPAPLNSIIGRQIEMEKVNHLLQRARLVTLTGTGGVGKTRLAIAIAEKQLTKFPDGVRMVALEALSEPKMLLNALAALLGITEQLGYIFEETIINQLRLKRMLLLFDNCEHLLPACGHLVMGFLHSCPELRILATSREALGVEGETIYSVPPLPFPGSNTGPAMEMQSFDSVRLFIERASAASANFTLTNKNLSTIARICNQLEGIPLAIELAAARVQAFSVEYIASDLEKSFRFLSGRSQNFPSRHQTMQASIDWSYRLLSEEERTLLRRISVFSGGWTLLAAESVCSDQKLPSSKLFDLLAQLVKKSLVQIVQEPQTRYSLLETIHQYSYEKLAEAGEMERLRDRHLRYYLSFVETNEMKLRTAERVFHLDETHRELNNLRSAIRWSQQNRGHNNKLLGLRLVSSLRQFWHLFGYHAEGQSLLIQILENISGETPIPEAALAKGFFASGFLHLWRGETLKAIEMLEKSIALYRMSEDRSGLAEALNYLASATALGTGSFSRAQAVNEESIAKAREADDPWCLALCLYWRANLALQLEDYPLTKMLSEQSWEIFNKVGDQWSAAGPLMHLGHTQFVAHNFLTAQRFYQKSFAAFEAGRGKAGAVMNLAFLGCIHYLKKEYEQVLDKMQACLERFQYLDLPAWQAWSLEMAGVAARRLGNDQQAVKYYLQALQLVISTENREAFNNVLARLAGISAYAGHTLHAARLYGAAGINLNSDYSPVGAFRFDKKGLQGKPTTIFNTFLLPMKMVRQAELNEDLVQMSFTKNSSDVKQAYTEGRSLTLLEVLQAAEETRDQVVI